jgi:sigma-B regulation protein RsbQ
MTTAIQQKFNVNVIGSGDQRLVLGHGFGSDQTTWRYQVAAFASQYRLVLFDYLGCGKADIHDYSPLRYNSLERYKDDLLAIYDELQLTGTIFIGHSVSAMIGVLASRERPELFKKLVFVGASPRYLNDGAYVGGFEMADLNALYAVMADNYLGWANGFGHAAMANASRPELGCEFAASLSAMRPDIAQSTARVIFESDERIELPQIVPPVLILQSTKDIAVPMQVGEYLAAHVPQNRLVVLNSEGHFPHLSAPDQVTAAISDFLGSSTS